MNRWKFVAKGAARSLAVALLAAMPAFAQDNGTASPPPPANSSDIGPGELSNFSLPGTVTRPADRPAVTPPASSAPPTTVAPAPVRDNRPPTVAPAAGAVPAPRTPDNDLFRRPPTLPDASATTSVSAAPPPTADVGPPAAQMPSGGFSLFPWIIAFLAVAGGAFLWFGLQRRRSQRYASASNAPIDITSSLDSRPRPDPPVAGSPRPDPVASPRTASSPAAASPSPVTSRKPLPTTLMPQPQPRAQPRPDPIVPGGIVSTGLRPWIDVELSPDRALLDEQGAAIAFEVTLYNSGSAAARDVIIEAKLINAGAGQDVELSAFFTADTAVGDPIPHIAPYARVPLRSAVRLPRAAISEYDYEGRKLFMPMVAISVRYRWSTGDGQSAAGFLVGQGADGQDKLAPLRVDRGARSWNGLGARRYEKGVRR